MLVGDQADRRPHQPARHHPDHRRPGHRRADGAHGDRRRDPAGRARGRGARSRRPGDPRLPAAAGPRLHAASSNAERAARARASASRARSSTTRPRRRARRSRAAASTPSRPQAMAEAIAVLTAAGRGGRRSGRHPERGRHASRSTTSCCGRSARGLDNAKGKDADCSIVFKYGMKRDFNAWLASLGPARAGEDARPSCAQWNVAHQKAGAHQVRPGAARHLRRDGPGARPRALPGRPRQGPAARRGTQGIDAVMKAAPAGRAAVPRRQRRRASPPSPATRR